jgi:hypothetical protein
VVGKISAEIKIGKVNGAKESVGGDDGVEEKIDTGKRGNVGGGGTGGLMAVTSGGAANPTFDAGGEVVSCAADLGEREREEGGGRGGPLLFGNGVKIGGRGRSELDRIEGEGASGLD